MRRREFIVALGSAAAWPLSAWAQQSTRVATIGFLDATSRSTQGRMVSEFVQRLRELGWREGQNLVVEVRWAEGQPERYAEIVAEFVRLKVDVIVTYSLPAIFAAKQATSTIVAARTLGIEYVPLEIQRAADIDSAITSVAGRADALYVAIDPLLNTHRLRINTLALGAHLPTSEPFREFVEAAGLMSYGANLPDLYR